jgi:hypothetical protein
MPKIDCKTPGSPPSDSMKPGALKVKVLAEVLGQFALMAAAR